MIGDKNREKLFWIFQVTGWSIYAVYDYLVVSSNKLAPIYYNFAGSFITIGTGFITTICLRYIYKKINVFDKNPLSLLVLIFLISIFGSATWFLLDFLLSSFLYGFDVMFRVYLNFPTSYFIYEYLKYTLVIVTWSGIYLGMQYLLRWQLQKEKTEAALLRAEIAELKVLRFQLNPHFLFNSLSSLRSLIREDKQRAEEMLTKISDFLRYALSSSTTKEVSLGEEIEALRNFIEIEKTKHGKKLVVNIDVSQLAEEYPIPILLLHPILENAIKYGSQNKTEELIIDLSAKVKNNWVEISIQNNGVWIDQSFKKKVNGTSTGLRNVEDRLKRYYPEGNELIIEKNTKCVKVTIKYKRDLNIEN